VTDTQKELCSSDLFYQNLNLDNMRRHGFFRPFPHAHKVSTQYNPTLAKRDPLYHLLPPSLIQPCSPLPKMMLTAKYVRVCLRNIKCSFVTYITLDGISSVDCLFPPLTTIPHGTWKCPLCTPRHSLPQAATQHLCLASLILDFDSDWNLNTYLYIYPVIMKSTIVNEMTPTSLGYPLRLSDLNKNSTLKPHP